MKRSHKLLFVLATVLLMMLISTSALAETLRFGTVRNASTLNLRAGASTSAQKIGYYTKNTWLRVTGENGSWYQVIGPDGKSGYVSKEYLYISAGAKGIIGIVDTNGSLNLRASASSSGRIIGSYPDGTPCILLSEKGAWYQVTVDGKAGYFSADHIDKAYMTYSPDVATVVSQNGGAVNLRKGPGKEYGVVKSIKNGSYAMILQQGNGWWKISVNGYVGYMDSSFLKDGIVSKSSASSGSSSSSSSSSSSNGYALVNTSKLILRASATKSSKSLGSFARDTYVTVLEKGNTWCKVKVNGTTGYMMTMYLKFPGSSGSVSSGGSSSSSSSSGYAVVNTSNLYLRTSASKSSKSLGLFARGTYVTVLEQGNTWCKVKVNGVTGYMMTEYLKFYGLNASAVAYVDHPDRTYVNLRNAPSKSTGAVLVKVPHGAKVTVLVPGTTWTQIQYNGKTGYMMTQYLDN